MLFKNHVRHHHLKTHEMIIRLVAIQLQKEGYSVCVNGLNGFKPCKNFKGFVPDIQATKNFEKIIIEVKTSGNGSSKDLIKWKRFSASDKNQFWLVVPETCLETFKNKKDSFHLSISVYTANKNGELELIF